MAGDDELVAQQKPAFIEFLKSVRFAAAGDQAGLPPSHPPVGDGAMPMMSAGAGAATSGSNEGKPDWQVPAGWQETAGSQFLVAKFLIPGADNSQASVNVSMSAGDGGGLAPNVNRWRGQLGLSPLSGADLNQAVTGIDTAGGQASLVDFSGKDPRSGQDTRMVAAIVPQGGRTWFYKLMGNAQLVEKQKDAFTKFVQTAKY
jgi:hypothetical protein